MNLGRFHAAIHSLNNEFQEINIAQLLAQIQAALKQSINTPNASTAEAFKASYTKTIVALSEASSNTTFPTRKKIFEDIGADRFIGNGLANKITSLFSENQITPANALAEFQTLVQQIDQFYKRITVLDDTFGAMELEYDDLEAGQFEIGLSLPRSVVGSTAVRLKAEQI
ncbi:MAG: hypothetical protein FD134_2150 [Gallionellaceae bacterium]|nr:MAG: hypothetical protein FD134_2150 [Gallionellaceae bacterium]